MIHIKDNNNNWTVVAHNKSYQFNSTHPEYVNLIDAIRKDDEDMIFELMETGTMIDNWSQGNFSFKDGVLTYNFGGLQEEVQPIITERIISHMKEGIDHQYLMRYIDNVYQNPSHRAVYEGFNFLTNHNLPITKDGYIMAYKAVTTYHGEPITDVNGNVIKDGDLVDKWTGKSHRNNVGDKPTMPRRLVDDNCGTCCSQGLHVGSTYYAESYGVSGDTAILVKVHPRDIVSVPSSDSEKMRVCAYEVVGLYNGNLIPPVVNEEDPYDYEDDDDYYDDDDDYYDDEDWDNES